MKTTVTFTIADPQRLYRDARRHYLATGGDEAGAAFLGTEERPNLSACVVEIIASGDHEQHFVDFDGDAQ